MRCIIYLIMLCAIILLTGTSADGSGVRTVPKKECYGTRNGLSYNGKSDTYWYRLIRKMYTNCTHVEGNLEITNLWATDTVSYDLSFLATIEVVTGYVLIGNVRADVIPLTSLRYIRGDETFHFGSNDYVLSVLLSHSRDGLQMPAIKEITGDVIFKRWWTCFGHSIYWGSFTQGNVSYSQEEIDDCGECDPACIDTDDVRRCWGPGNDMCQTVNTIECNWLCRNGTCHDEGMMDCCHPECLGCTDGWIDTACQYCRHVEYNGHCLPECPHGTYQYIDTCMPILPPSANWIDLA